MDKEKLKPCPFCGYNYAEIEKDKEGFVYIRCHKSGCMARTDGCLNENEAARLWNTRKPTDKIIEQLKEQKKWYANNIFSGFCHRCIWQVYNGAIDKAIKIVKGEVDV